MQLLKPFLVATIMAVGAAASAIPSDGGGKIARQSSQCEIPPPKICQPSGDPMACNFCCVNFNTKPWSACHQHGEVPCSKGGKIWHCETHT